MFALFQVVNENVFVCFFLRKITSVPNTINITLHCCVWNSDVEIDVALPSCTGTPRLIREQHRNPIVMAIHGVWTAVIATPMATPPDRAELLDVNLCRHATHLMMPHYLKICSTFLHPNRVNISMRKYCITFMVFYLCEGILFLQPLTMFIFPLELVEHRDRHRHDNTDSQRQIRPIYDCKLQSSLLL